MKLILLFAILLSPAQLWGKRILAVLPSPEETHFVYTHAILTQLAMKKHQVTLVSPFLPENETRVTNINYIQVKTEHGEIMKNKWASVDLNEIPKNTWDASTADVVWQDYYSISRHYLNSNELLKILGDGMREKYFDVLLTEALHGQESLLIIGSWLNIPVVNLHIFGPWSVINRVHGNDLQVNSYPDVLSFPYSNNMTLWERISNAISTSNTIFAYYRYHLPKHESIISDMATNVQLDLADEVAKISVSLINYHPMVGYPIALPPNMVPVAGVHINPNGGRVDLEMKKYLDSSKIIYVNLGSVVPLDRLPPHIIKNIITALKGFPKFKVLWRADPEFFKSYSHNFKIIHSLPQQGILAHTNVKLFITNGGLLSQQEAIYFATPVIGIPLYGDQFSNVHLYEKLGMGLKVDLADLTVKTFNDAIYAVTVGTWYYDIAAKWAKVFRSRQPLARRLIHHWVRYVCKRKNTHHLRPITAIQRWYRLNNVDFVFTILIVLLLALFCFCRCVCKRICRRTSGQRPDYGDMGDMDMQIRQHNRDDEEDDRPLVVNYRRQSFSEGRGEARPRQQDRQQRRRSTPQPTYEPGTSQQSSLSPRPTRKQQTKTPTRVQPHRNAKSKRK